jgi:NTE family protein
MKTYVILAGGGVKGIALAGCLAAAEDKGLEFVGYGGTSAGSIVALLGAVGYKGSEIRDLMRLESFASFLDDGGTELEALKGLAKVIFEDSRLKPVRVAKRLFSERKLIRKLYSEVGLYGAANLESFLLDKVKDRYPRIGDDFNFSDLYEAAGRSLKVVAADIVARKSLTFSMDGKTSTELDLSVITAVRASMSYPFVFKPVKMHKNYLSDGGLTSNLPVFLFERERKSTNLPVLAFDLIVPPRQRSDVDYKLLKFSEDLLMTTMESSDKLLRGLITGLHYIPIIVPDGIDTLKFSLSSAEQEELYGAGYGAASRYLEEQVGHWFKRGEGQITELQAQRSLRPETVEGLLAVAAQEFESKTQASGVRSCVMLPTSRDTQVIVYQHGMTGDPDADLEIGLQSGCSGKAYSEREVVAADLTEAQWGLSINERAKIRADRQAALSIPLFDVSSSVNGRINAAKDRLLGVLNIDTGTSLPDAGWGTLGASPGRSFDLNGIARRLCLLWGEVFSRLLS